jgi:hypothetical protein
MTLVLENDDYNFPKLGPPRRFDVGYTVTLAADVIVAAEDELEARELAPEMVRQLLKRFLSKRDGGQQMMDNRCLIQEDWIREV